MELGEIELPRNLDNQSNAIQSQKIAHFTSFAPCFPENTFAIRYP